MKQHTFICDKLVRHKDPQWLESQGIHVKVRKLDNHEMMTYLKRKLQEEATEAIEATLQTKMISELIDVVDAVHALCDLLGVDKHEFEKLHREKLEKKGNYSQGVYLDSVTLDEDNPQFSHYNDHSYRYPEK